ncbi:unnamed protein product, partial [Iphiclides podalirius]
MASLFRYVSLTIVASRLSLYGNGIGNERSFLFLRLADINFLSRKINEKITPYEVTSLLRKTINNVSPISKGESIFRATGIYPINPDVFSEEDFLPAELLQSETTAIQNYDESDAIDDPASGQGESSITGTSMIVGSLKPPSPPPTSSAVDYLGPGLRAGICLRLVLDFVLSSLPTR